MWFTVNHNAPLHNSYRMGKCVMWISDEEHREKLRRENPNADEATVNSNDEIASSP